MIKLAENGTIRHIDAKALRQVKGIASNPSVRMYNWNVIIKELSNMDIQLDQDERKRMVNGQGEEIIIGVLLSIYQLEIELGISKESPMAPEDDQNKTQNDMESPSRLSLINKEVKPEQPINVMQLKGDKPLEKTETTLEFVIVSLCQALGITVKQAAGLLTDHNYYLMHACVKGLKGDHNPILRWYQLLIQSSKILIDLAVESLPVPEDTDTPLNDSQITEEDAQPLFVLLGALKCGFFSDNFSVSNIAFKLFSQISSVLNSYGYQKVFARWLFQQPDQENGKLGGGLEATLYMLNKHSQIVESVALLLISSFKGSMELLLPEIKDTHIKDNLPKYYTLVNDLLPYLHKNHRQETVEKLLVKSTLIEDLIKQAETTNLQLKSVCLSLLAEIWTLEPQLISENTKTLSNGNTILDSCLRVFKNTCKFSSKALKISSVGLMFKLLDIFASTRNNQAPVIYKLLTFALVENFEDEDLREFMLTSFTQVFSQHKTIPISILIEPLLRMISLNEKPKFRFNVGDFEFFKLLSSHPKLTASPLGIQFLDLLAKSLLNNPLWASAALSPFQLLLDRFNKEPVISEFLMKFSSIAIAQVLDLNKKEVRNDEKYYEEESLRRIKLAHIIKALSYIINLKIPQHGKEPLLNDYLKDLILQTNRSYKQLHGIFSGGLIHLLEFWHPYDAQTIMNNYMHQKDLEEIDEEDIQTIQVHYSPRHIQEEIHNRFVLQDDHYDSEPYPIHQDEDDYFKLLPTETRNSEISSRALNNINNQSQVSNNRQRTNSRNGNGSSVTREIVPYVEKGNKPPLMIKKRVDVLAHRQIEAIKNKREEKAVQQQIEDERKRILFERNVKKAKEVVDKRKIQLGVNKGLPQESSSTQLVLYEEPIETGSQPKRQSLPNTQKDEGMKLIDLENEEEERDRDGVKILLTKYQKVFKFLFNKYAHSSAQHKKIEKFEYYGEKQINPAEICKFLRDHDLLASLSQTSMMTQVVTNNENSSAYQRISKDQLSILIRLLNLKNFKRQDLSPLSFAHFLDLMPQIAFLLYNKTLPHLSLPEMIVKMLENNERVTKIKGQSTLLYEDPDITTIGDQEMMKEINRRLRENSDYIMPEGYYKVQEKQQRFNYSIPQEMPIKEQQRIAIETLDAIIADKFGFHILEAIVTYESHFKVKPRIKHSAAPKPQQAESALSYMKPIEKKPIIRGQSALKQPQTNSAPLLLTPITLDNQVKDPYIRPKLGVDLKLQVIAYQNRRPPIEKQLIQDTAEFLEELLTAVDQGLTALPERQKNKPELRNKALEDKDLKLKQDNDLYKQKEDLRKKRHTLLQQELERKKQEKLKQEEEQKSSKVEVDKESKQKEQREKSVARQKLEAKRQMIEEAKRQKQEEKDAKLREDEEKKNREKAERVVQQKEFFKKQKEQLEAEFQKRRQEQEEAVRIKSEMEEIKKQQQEYHKNKMVEHLKQNKDQNRNEQAEWQSIGEFYQEVQASVFPRYEKAMGIMFKHYASLDKKDMAQQGMQRINLNEFSKFGLQTKITPKVISNDDLTFIFRALIRERTSTMTQKELDFLGMGVNSLGIEDFKKALIRIAILGQQNLSEGEQLANLLPHLSQDPNSKIVAPTTIRAPRNIRIRGRSQMNSQASQRQLQHQNSNTDLQQEGSLEKNPASKRTSLAARKTKEQRQIEELTKAKERQEKMMNMRIEDKRLTKGFDVSLINSDTIEALIQYMQLQPNKNMQIQLGDTQNQEEEQFEKGEEENQDEMQGNGHDQNDIEGVDMEELERQEDGYQEDIIAPDGKQENWKVAD